MGQENIDYSFVRVRFFLVREIMRMIPKFVMTGKWTVIVYGLKI